MGLQHTKQTLIEWDFNTQIMKTQFTRTNNNIIHFTKKRFFSKDLPEQINIKPNFPSEADLPSSILKQEGMVKIANRFGNTSALLIDFLLREQEKIGETILIPMGRGFDEEQLKMPNFISEKEYKSSSNMILNNAEKIWFYLNQKPYHSIAVDLTNTEWCVVDVDKMNESIKSNLLNYAKTLECFFLIDKSLKGYHLWSNKPRSEKLKETRLANQYCMGGFRYDLLSIKYCIVSLGKGRNVIEFNPDRMENLPALFWPIPKPYSEGYELEQGVLRKGERYSTFEARLREAFKQQIPITLSDL